MTQPRDWDRRADELAARAIGRGEPTAWFDELYAEGRAGVVGLPWDRTEPQPLLREWLAEWLERDGGDGAGRRAVVVGCGLGADAAYLDALGLTATGFDLSPTAIDLARTRHPGVDLHVADLLDLPPEWAGAFDLVVEVYTLQAVPDPPREAMADAVVSLVAPGGTLIAVAFRDEGTEPAGVGPPFPLTRGFMESLARDGLEVVALEELPGGRWRATYRR